MHLKYFDCSMVFDFRRFVYIRMDRWNSAGIDLNRTFGWRLFGQAYGSSRMIGMMIHRPWRPTALNADLMRLDGKFHYRFEGAYLDLAFLSPMAAKRRRKEGFLVKYELAALNTCEKRVFEVEKDGLQSRITNFYSNFNKFTVKIA